MAEITVSVQRTIAAPPEKTFQYITDAVAHRCRWLPDSFSNCRVERRNGETFVLYHLKAGRRERDYRMRLAEPEPGILVEADTTSSLITTWKVIPDGQGSLVELTTRWQGASGVGGFFERTFAPRVLRNLYVELLDRLNAYAQQQQQ